MKGLSKKLLGLFFCVSLTIFSSFCFSYAGQESAYDQAQGVAGESFKALQEGARGNIEGMREEAGRGFDNYRTTNVSPGTEYIPTPKPSIEKGNSQD